MDRKNNIFNDNERLNNRFSINDIVSKDPYYIDKTADWLTDYLKAPSSRPYFCKIAKYISKKELEGMLNKASSDGFKPIKLFIYLAEQKLKFLGVKK